MLAVAVAVELVFVFGLAVCSSYCGQAGIDTGHLSLLENRAGRA